MITTWDSSTPPISTYGLLGRVPELTVVVVARGVASSIVVVVVCSSHDRTSFVMEF